MFPNLSGAELYVATILCCKEIEEDLFEIKGNKLKNTRIMQSDYRANRLIRPSASKAQVGVNWLYKFLCCHEEKFIFLTNLLISKFSTTSRFKNFLLGLHISSCKYFSL
jgi:hypothetical protein